MASLRHQIPISSMRGLLEKPHILKDLSFLVKFWFFKSDWFWIQIWLSLRFTPISLFYKNCNQIGPQTPLQRLKFFNLERNLKIWLGSSLATSNFCLLTQGILEQPHILKYLSFLVKFVFFKSDFHHDLPQFISFTRIATKSALRPLFKDSYF